MDLHRPLRVGIVGCGDIAVAHARAYRYLGPDAARVLAVADVDPNAAKRLAEADAAGAAAFDSLEAMAGEVKLDAISLCVPNHLHRDVTLQALAAGLHVLCEKPPGRAAHEALAMAKAAKAAERVLTYMFEYREMVPTARRFLAQIGPVDFAHASFVRERGIPGWGAYGSHAVQGGGAMIDLGVHPLDLAWYLMGRPQPRRVSARTWQRKAKTSQVGLLGTWDRAQFDVEDHAHAVIDFDDARLVIEAAFALDTGISERASVELQGRDGRLVIPLMTTQQTPDPACAPTLHTEQAGTLVTTQLRHPLPPTTADGITATIDAFVAACRGISAPLVTPTDGVVVQQMLGAIYDSAAQDGQAVRLESLT